MTREVRSLSREFIYAVFLNNMLLNIFLFYLWIYILWICTVPNIHPEASYGDEK